MHSFSPIITLLVYFYPHTRQDSGSHYIGENTELGDYSWYVFP